MRKTAEITVHFDAAAAGGSHYTVTRCDESGAALSHEGSFEDLQSAWDLGCRLADEHGVSCVEYGTADAVATGHSTDRYGEALAG